MDKVNPKFYLSESAEKGLRVIATIKRLIEENGTLPWRNHLTLAAMTSDVGPVGAAGNLYRGSNALLLSLDMIYNERRNRQYVTYLQANERGGGVKTGARGWPINYWKRAYRERGTGRVLSEKERKELIEDGREEEFFISWSAFPTVVFSVEDCKMEADPKYEIKTPERAKRDDDEKYKAAERIISEYKDGPKIIHAHGVNLKGASGAYSREKDAILMPFMAEFDTLSSYYSSLFHEAGHSTGHMSRLNRKGGPFGSSAYAKEELVAELASSLLMEKSGLLEDEGARESADYIDKWTKEISTLSDRDFERAVGDALKAVDWITGERDGFKRSESLKD